MNDRHVALQGAFNFRDLGGMEARDGRRVRPGRVFRSDALHRLAPADHGVLAPLAIARVVDLRCDSEIRRDGEGAIPGARRLHAPLVETTLSPFDPEIDWERIDLGKRYLEMLTVGGAAITTVLESAAEAPVVFHCSAGKDRTGVVAAVLLAGLGVPDDAIVEDYALSEARLREQFASLRAELVRQRFSPAVVEYITSSPARRMREMLAELVRRWGSIEDYLAWIGVGDELCDRLRATLLH